MTADSDFTRVVRSWLHEDAGEDPTGVLDRVAAIVAEKPQARHASAFLPRASTARSARLVATVAAGIVVVIAFGLLVPRLSLGPAATPTPAPSPTSTPGVSPSDAGVVPSAIPGLTLPSLETPREALDPSDPSSYGVANDEPCMRTVAGVPRALLPVEFHHEDLERMVLGDDDVGGLAGFDQDQLAQGYHDNAELTGIEVNPATTCDDIARFGRIEGYGNVYSSVEPSRKVLFAVHLFWTTEEAAGWTAAFTGGLEAAADASGGSITFREAPGSLDVADATLYEHVGPEGVRTWAILRRGPIVGWVVDLHPAGAAATVDVPAAATTMAARIEAVAADVVERPRNGLDAVQLLSAPLPRAAYGPVAADFVWDWFFGGCHDTFERVSIVGEKAAVDAERFGRLTGCQAMYVPEGSPGDVVRVFSSVQVYRDAAGASGAVAEGVEDQEARGGERFDAGGVGDEGAGVSTPGGGPESPADTRVVTRIGNLVATVSIQGRAAVGQEAYVIELARRLEARIRTVLGSA